MYRWKWKLIKTKTTVLACVYVSNDTSSVSAWCLHKAQTMLSSEQYFCKKSPFFLIRKISSILEVIHGPAQVDNFNLYDVDRTSALLTRPSAFPICHPLWNAIPKKEGVSPISADCAPKIGCHGNVPSPFTNRKTNTRLNIYATMSTTLRI